MGQYGWHTREEGESTPDYLGRVLEKYLGFKEMATRARAGHFDDYFCPPEIADGMEIIRLYTELHENSKKIHVMSPQFKRISEVLNAIKNGEFDATKEESDRWAASPDGQETMRMLIEGE